MNAGDFRKYSLESLFRLLTALGRDVDIVMRQPRLAADGKLAARRRRRALSDVPSSAFGFTSAMGAHAQ